MKIFSTKGGEPQQAKTGPELLLGLETTLAELLQEIFALREGRSKEMAVEPGSLPKMGISIAMSSAYVPPAWSERVANHFSARGGKEGAFLLSVRTIGKAIFEIGGFEAMEDICDKVSNIPLACYGHTQKGSDFSKQASVITSHWNGIGPWVS